MATYRDPQWPNSNSLTLLGPQCPYPCEPYVHLCIKKVNQLKRHKVFFEISTLDLFPKQEKHFSNCEIWTCRQEPIISTTSSPDIHDNSNIWIWTIGTISVILLVLFSWYLIRRFRQSKFSCYGVIDKKHQSYIV